MTQFTHTLKELYIVHALFTRYNIVPSQFDTGHSMFTSYDTVHTHFEIVHTHFDTGHSMFTQYDTVHTHFDIDHTLFLTQFTPTLAQLTHCSQAMT